MLILQSRDRKGPTSSAQSGKGIAQVVDSRRDPLGAVVFDFNHGLLV